MKRRYISFLMAVTVFASAFTGCGKADSTEKTAEKDAVSEESSDKEDSNKEGSEKTADEIKWDGTFDFADMKIKLGMTVNEIAAQGDYVIVNGKLPYEEDYDLVDGALDGMVVAPCVKKDDRADLLANEKIDIYIKDGDSLTQITEGDTSIFYYNPYPYAVSLGECVVGRIYKGKPEGYDSWDANKDGEVDFDEFNKSTGMELKELKSGFWGVENEDYCVLVTEQNDFVTYINVSDYGLMATSEDIFDKLEGNRPGKGFKVIAENLGADTSSVEFKMGYGTYSLDTSCIDNISEISRCYVEESDYTTNISISGSIDGEPVRLILKTAEEGNYYPIEKYYATTKFDNVEKYEASNGEEVFGSPSSTVFKLFDGSVFAKLDFAHTNFSADQLKSAKDKVTSCITEVK